jgi:hypothetical protein
MGSVEQYVDGPGGSRLRVTSPAPRGVWRQVLASDPAATICQTPAWLDAICASTAYTDASRLYETATGRQLILPMVRRAGLPRALTIAASPPPNWGTGGLVASGSARPEDVAVVWPDLLSRPAARVRVRPHHLAADAWDAARPPSIIVAPQMVHVLDLEGGFERVWEERFKKDTRKAVRKGERAGLVAECDTSGRLVPVFYGLYVDWVTGRARERGLPPWLVRRRDILREPLRKYQAVAEHLGDACRVWVAWLDGEPVATLISLVFGRHAQSWRGFGRMDLAGPTRANNFLQRAAIEDACRAGCRTYNMGESGGVASLMEFKRRHGAEQRQFAEYIFERVPFTRLEGWRVGLERQVGQLLLRGARR